MGVELVQENRAKFVRTLGSFDACLDDGNPQGGNPPLTIRRLRHDRNGRRVANQREEVLDEL